MQTLKGNDQDKHPLHHEPTVSVLKEDGLHASIGNGPNLRIVGRVQVKKREGLRSGDGIERVALYGLDSGRTCDPRSLCVQFDPVTPNVCAACHEMQCCSLSDARVDHRRWLSERKQAPELCALTLRQGVVPHFQAGDIAHELTSRGFRFVAMKSTSLANQNDVPAAVGWRAGGFNAERD
jgi:hypothetical protein